MKHSTSAESSTAEMFRTVISVEVKLFAFLNGRTVITSEAVGKLPKVVMQ